MSRELKPSEESSAWHLCIARYTASDGTHHCPMDDNAACPTCRADVVRLVDGEPTVDAERLADEFGNLPAAAFDTLARAILDAARVDAPPSERVPEILPEDIAWVRTSARVWIAPRTDDGKRVAARLARILAALEYCAALNRRSDGGDK